MEKEQMLLSHFENLYLFVAVARAGIRTRAAVVTFRSLDHSAAETGGNLGCLRVIHTGCHHRLPLFLRLVPRVPQHCWNLNLLVLLVRWFVVSRCSRSVDFLLLPGQSAWIAIVGGYCETGYIDCFL